MWGEEIRHYIHVTDCSLNNNMNALLHFNRYIVRLYSGRRERERERERERDRDRQTETDRQTDRHGLGRV